MRIVHITDAYLPRLGGIETHVADLASHQTGAGHEVHIVTSTGDETDAHAQVHRVPGGWIRDMVLGSLRSAQVVSDLRPDVVHCHNSVLSPLAVNMALSASAAGVPTAVTVHSLLPPVGPILPLSGTVLAVRKPRIAWSAVSEVAAEPLRRVLGPRTEVAVLPNAVDVAWWRDAPPPSPARRTREVRVISVGRMASRKRPAALLRMMHRVHALAPDVPLRLVLVGDGPQRGRLETLAAELGMTPWVDMPGRLARCDIRDALAAADIYVAPANLESFGIAALEARAVGLPIVAKSRGGVGEFVSEGTEGLLATSDRDMARAIARLVDSPSLRWAMREHNGAVAPAFGWDDAMVRTQQLYARAEELAGRSASVSPAASVRVAVDAEALR
ncbi:MAG: glycosyltransferase family 4 protein [Actinomycetes bacterium]